MHDPLPIVKDPFIPMEEPRKRLMRLEEHIPDDNSNGLLHEFGRFLAGYISQARVSAIGFVIDCEYAMHDIQTGLNRRTMKVMQNRLTGQLPSVYKSLHAQVPVIAEAIFPPNFAAAVQRCFEEFNTESPKGANAGTGAG